MGLFRVGVSTARHPQTCNQRRLDSLLVVQTEQPSMACGHVERGARREGSRLTSEKDDEWEWVVAEK